MNRKIVFEDGTEYFGIGFGAMGTDSVGEISFNTSMVGYQEVILNPANGGKIMLLTYPLIGNVGIVDDDRIRYDLDPQVVGLVVRKYSDDPTSFRYSRTLSEYLETNGVPAIEEVDTREIFRKLSRDGASRVIITDIATPTEEAIARIKNTPPFENMVKKISCLKPWYARTSRHKYSVVGIDCGICKSTVDKLKTMGCNVIVMPYDTTADKILALNPDGVLFSDGPSSAKEIPEVVKTAKALLGKVPMYGIGLGMQVLASMYSCRIERMKLGHHGANYPISDILANRVDNLDQSHDYIVNRKDMEKANLQITFENLLDGSVEAFRSEKDRVVASFFDPSVDFDNQFGNNPYREFAMLMQGGKK